MKVISLPEIASRIRYKRSGRTFLAEFINQCKIEDAIIIPNGATNGEVVEKIFDKSIYYTLISMMYVSCCEKFDKWWNAPYKGNLSEKPTGSESEDV